MLQSPFRQFSGPEGPLGHVAGWLMVRKHRGADAWLVELLAAGPADRVVEVGFSARGSRSRATRRAAPASPGWTPRR